MTRRSFLTFVSVVVLAVGEFTGTVRAAPVLPDFSAATFIPGASIDNPYFPLVPGTVRRYAGEIPGEPAKLEELEEFVTFNTRLIAGVLATEVRSRTRIDGALTDDSLNFFAQDNTGNVWYLGKSNATNPGASWQAGVNGAQPGFIMPANRTVGQEYFQVSAVPDGIVEDAEIERLDGSVFTPAGSFDEVVQILVSKLGGQPEVNHYAPGVGLVRIGKNFSDSGGAPLTEIDLQSVTVIPLPPGVIPALATIMLTGVVHRFRRRA